LLAGGTLALVNVTFESNSVAGGAGGAVPQGGARNGAAGSGIGPDLYVSGGALVTNEVLTTGIQGVGEIVIMPNAGPYSLGQQVSLTATPARWFAFSRWSDGVTNQTRTITIGLTNNYTVVFSPITPVETLSFGSQSRTAPVGMPAVLVNGELFSGGAITCLRSVHVEVQSSFPGAKVFMSFNGQPPSESSRHYRGPFNMVHSAKMRVIAYKSDLSSAWEADPIDVTVVPAFELKTVGGGGSVNLSPAASLYLMGSVVTVTAEPEPGWTFMQWLGDAIGTNSSVVVPMDGDRNAWAVFGTTLQTDAIGNGSVAQVPQAAVYPYGTTVRLAAVAQSGNGFVSWSNAVAGTRNPETLVVTNPRPLVAANFGPLNPGQVALTVVPFGGGQVAVSPNANLYSRGDVVALTAVADPGQEFSRWDGDAGGTEDPLSLTLDSSKVVLADFSRRPVLEVLRLDAGIESSTLRMRLVSEMKMQFIIERSSELQNWSPLTGVTNLVGAVDFSDLVPTNAPQHFYRAVSPP
jgi:hypothetical protein